MDVAGVCGLQQACQVIECSGGSLRAPDLPMLQVPVATESQEAPVGEEALATHAVVGGVGPKVTPGLGPGLHWPWQVPPTAVPVQLPG